METEELISFALLETLGKQKYDVNFALDPAGYQNDLFQEISYKSRVEYGLASFHKLESIGIKDEDSTS